jgi:type II secretory pathway component PulF
MIFNYEAISNTGEKKKGTVEASSKDTAIAAVQHRGLIVVSVHEETEKKGLMQLSFFEKSVAMKDIVIMSRQISTLFEAQVSALKAFTLLVLFQRELSPRVAVPREDLHDVIRCLFSFVALFYRGHRKRLVVRR